MREYERMISGQAYDPSDMELRQLGQKGRLAMERYNALSRTEKEARYQILKETFAAIGQRCHIESPFYVDYGCNISVGEYFYANFDCIMLDVAPITIGRNVMFGPRVSLYTATHPLDAGVRNRIIEFGKPITIGDECWLGGNVVVNPGVTIGDECWLGGNVVVNPGVTIGPRTVVASGSVVTKDLPADVLAAGNPARIIRTLGQEERLHWEAVEADYFASKAAEEGKRD